MARTIGMPRIPIPSQPMRVVPGAALPCAAALQRMHRAPLARSLLHKSKSCFSGGLQRRPGAELQIVMPLSIVTSRPITRRLG